MPERVGLVIDDGRGGALGGPPRYGAAQVEPLLDEVNHSDELLNRLR